MGTLAPHLDPLPAIAAPLPPPIPPVVAINQALDYSALRQQPPALPASRAPVRFACPHCRTTLETTAPPSALLACFACNGQILAPADPAPVSVPEQTQRTHCIGCRKRLVGNVLGCSYCGEPLCSEVCVRRHEKPHAEAARAAEQMRVEAEQAAAYEHYRREMEADTVWRRTRQTLSGVVSFACVALVLTLIVAGVWFGMKALRPGGDKSDGKGGASIEKLAPGADTKAGAGRPPAEPDLEVIFQHSPRRSVGKLVKRGESGTGRLGRRGRALHEPRNGAKGNATGGRFVRRGRRRNVLD